MRASALLALLIPLLLAAPASAADPDAVARAKDRFVRGAQAYREARYQDAIELFREANLLDPHPELVFNVGQAFEKLGDVPHALRSYREYLRLSPGASDRTTVEASIKNLEARLRERGVQQVTIFSTPAGATVLVDGKEVGRTPWTGEISPGRHLASLRSSGFADTTKEFVLTSDRALDVDIALSTAAPGPTTAPPAPPVVGPTAPPPPEKTPPPPPTEEPRKGVKPLTFVALGVGVAGLGAALGLEMARRSAESDAKSDPTQVGYTDKYNTMTTRQTAARVLVGVGAVATAAGGALLVIDLLPKGEGKRAGLGCFDGGCGAFATGRF